MSNHQPDGVPVPNDDPIPNSPPSKSSSSTDSTTSLTARLRVPTTYTTLPTQWLSSYQSFVRNNSSQVSSLESALRSLTYLLPSTRFADSTPIASESLHTFLSLLTAYNTHLLASPPFSPQRRYERFWEARSKLYARCAALLRTIQYTQLLLEMLAKRAGDKARWRVIVTLEVVKAVCRLFMGRASGSRPVIATGVGDERTERKVDVQPESDEHENDDAKEGGWKMPRTGMRLPQLPTFSSSSESESRESTITTFLSTRVITADEIKPPLRLVRPLSTPTARVSELLYILRPVFYALALQHYSPSQTNTNNNNNKKKTDWRPWLLGLGIELLARHLTTNPTLLPSNNTHTSPSPSTSIVETEESKRRGWRSLAWWAMRGAFYEKLTAAYLVRDGFLAGKLKSVPLVGDTLADYDILWGEYYFATATL